MHNDFPGALIEDYILAVGSGDQFLYPCSRGFQVFYRFNPHEGGRILFQDVIRKRFHSQFFSFVEPGPIRP